MLSASSLTGVALTWLAVIAAATYVFLWALLHLTQDTKEPVLLCTRVPFVSPLLGMVRWSKDFHAHMRKCNPTTPIYTLRLPGARLYIINSLALIPVVQRQWRTLIFAPVQVKAAKAGMGASAAAVRVLERDMVSDEGFVNGMVRATHPTMSSGAAGLEALNVRVGEVFEEALLWEVGSGDGKGGGVVVVSLYEWIGGLVMRATTEAVYGEGNPMRERRNLEAWKEYHPALMYIMLDILPQNLAFKRAIQAREVLIQSFAKYYADGSYKQGSAYIQAFVAHCIAQNIPEDDIARFLLGTVFNNVANSVPAAFWLIYRIFSDPEVLKDCRNEVLAQAVKKGEDDGDARVIDLEAVLNSCPVLMSTWHEVFRYHGMANSVRFVAEDHMLDGKHLLKKGGLVMMSARAQHTNAEVWGENVDEFDHRRFVKIRAAGKKRFNPVAFRAYGGGATLCPGRHFATSEILLLAAMLLLRFDMKPTGGKAWVLPSTGKSSQAEAVEQPDDDVEAELVRL